MANFLWITGNQWVVWGEGFCRQGQGEATRLGGLREVRLRRELAIGP
jgi:hypothetical protein